MCGGLLATLVLGSVALGEVTGVVEADVSVQATARKRTLGGSALLKAAVTTKNTFLRARVSGIGAREVASARLRLHVSLRKGSASDSGGAIYAISDCGWK